MRDLRLVELYPSIQGEGPHMGVVTTFVRFAGCNMRCPLWPCDTQHAIDPAIWAKESWKMPADVLAEHVVTGFPGSSVCVTGGEPTMQDAQSLLAFATNLLDRDYDIDVFTNGSLVRLPNWMIREGQVSVMMDWKLRGSGEAQTGVELRLENAQHLLPKDGIKFVIASDHDYEEAVFLWKAMVSSVSASFWAGVAWEKYSEEKLIHRVMEDDLPWRLNIQVHKFIFPDKEKGI